MIFITFLILQHLKNILKEKNLSYLPHIPEELLPANCPGQQRISSTRIRSCYRHFKENSTYGPLYTIEKLISFDECMRDDYNNI